ncbi:uncharacterized protein LOC129894889 [Solanum dulcamara]|uniref:uncharacterized protein LOC129894889 n=1 Tax=Solanum dulcamara TaxID=45834 RepID=UPI0024860DE6|nr:uncharacterized protein LOC129894889 [Solanum dulcamara]
MGAWSSNSELFISVLPTRAGFLSPERDRSCKANVVADALSQKLMSMDSLSCLRTLKRPLAREILALEARRAVEKDYPSAGRYVEACVIDFGGHWDKFLSLCELSYNNSYHLSIEMAPFEALYGRGCMSPIGWFEAGELEPLGVDLVRDAQNKVRSIQAKLLEAQSRQKEYADRKVRDMTFEASEQVLLKVSSIKGVMRFGKKGKLSPRYIGPFEILDCVRSVAYKLSLPLKLSGVHPMFHVSMLKKYYENGDYIIKLDSVLLNKEFQYEEETVAILDCNVRKLRTKEINMVKVKWKNHSVEKAT